MTTKEKEIIEEIKSIKCRIAELEGSQDERDIKLKEWCEFMLRQLEKELAKLKGE